MNGVNYLRLSLTDRCNLRCFYCMPKKGISLTPKEDILNFEEITRLISIFASIGIKHLRITGGEPLIRNELDKLIRIISEEIDDVSITTNGSFLKKQAKNLKKAGIKRINISLDTLKEKKFKSITGRDSFFQVMEGINQAVDVGFHPVKLNVVIMKDINDDEILDFVDFALAKGLILRFIEFMKITPLWKSTYFVPIETVKNICEKRFRLKKVGKTGPGPAEYFKVDENNLLGFIKTDEENCGNCSRLRCTSTGRLKICLYEDSGLHIKPLLRNGTTDGEIINIIKARIHLKRDVNYKKWKSNKIYMCEIGG